MNKTFSIKEALAFGFGKFKERPKFFVGLNLLYFFIVAVLPRVIQFVLVAIFPSDSPKEPSILASLLGALVSFGFYLFSVRLGLGQLAIMLDVTKGKVPQIKDLFSTRGLFFPYLFLSILSGVVIGFGVLFFIIPGIILGLMLAFSSFALLDEQKGIFTAMSRSQELTKGVRTKLLLFYLVVGLISVVGALCVGIGLLVALPVTSLASAYVYTTLKEQTGSSIPSSPNPPLASV